MPFPRRRARVDSVLEPVLDALRLDRVASIDRSSDKYALEPTEAGWDLYRHEQKRDFEVDSRLSFDGVKTIVVLRCGVDKLPEVYGLLRSAEAYDLAMNDLRERACVEDWAQFASEHSEIREHFALVAQLVTELNQMSAAFRDAEAAERAAGTIDWGVIDSRRTELESVRSDVNEALAGIKVIATSRQTALRAVNVTLENESAARRVDDVSRSSDRTGDLRLRIRAKSSVLQDSAIGVTASAERAVRLQEESRRSIGL